jgi:hypothetical protein
MGGTKCLLCGQVVYGLCPGINAIPGVVCDNYRKMQEQRFYDWVMQQSTKSTPRSSDPREGQENRAHLALASFLYKGAAKLQKPP